MNYRTGFFSLFVSLWVILFAITGCIRLDVEPIVLESGGRTPDANAPLVHVRVKGKRAHRTDWARARSMYRAFGSGVENKSGSLAQLTVPPVSGVLRDAGFRVDGVRPGGRAAAAKHAYELLIDFREAELTWQPPREFIQRPTARKRGRIDAEFHIFFTFRKLSSLNTSSRSAPLFLYECREKNRRRVIPGTHAEFMSNLAHRGLSTCLNEFKRRFIAVELAPQ